MFKHVIIALAFIALVSANPGPPAPVVASLAGGYGAGAGSSHQGAQNIGVHGSHLNFDGHSQGYGQGGTVASHH